MFHFEELDTTTREWMLREFEAEEDGSPYRSFRLCPEGSAAFPDVMREAIRNGNDVTLAASLCAPSLWLPGESYIKNGIARTRRINPAKAAEALAITEFNTWYVRGLARRLLEEGEETCEVYRADTAWSPRYECLQHEGQCYPVRTIYDGHRARYWPEPGNPSALSIPVGPNCHHTIRRVSTSSTRR